MADGEPRPTTTPLKLPITVRRDDGDTLRLRSVGVGKLKGKLGGELAGSSSLQGVVGKVPLSSSDLAATCAADGDCAAGPSKHISLSRPGWLTWACCQIPACILFGSLSALVITFHFWTPAFLTLLSLLTVHIYIWIAKLAIFGAMGAQRMRCEVAKDWEAEWQKFAQECPEDAAQCAHIVILPNYKEEEVMLGETLSYLARSSMARSRMRVVLAMEAREGDQAREKADRLIEMHSDKFVDLIATYHPENIANETAGKASNCQWAYREVLRRYGPEFDDPSKVFITVGDADSVWHPSYFTAMALEGLRMPSEKRQWSFWQPPVLLLRNFSTVPGPVRVSGYAAFCFEISGLAGQCFGTHLVYSSYSLTLAMAKHPLIDGWDTDVIAEDHHMFCKCYFASIWDAVNSSQWSSSSSTSLVPKVQLQPVFLPVTSYMVESADGWIASCLARFQQARRHAQGIAELSYVILQYTELLRSVGLLRLPLRTHWRILGICMKMTTVHIINTIHAFAVVLTSNLTVLKIWQQFSIGHLTNWLFVEVPETLSNGDFTSWLMLVILGLTGPLSILMTYTSFQVVRDSLEGRWGGEPLAVQTAPETSTAGAEEVSERTSAERQQSETSTSAGSSSSNSSSEGGNSPASSALQASTTKLSRLHLFLLAMVIWFDLGIIGETTVTIYGLIPEILASWSLSRSGTKFEYIVAAKPSPQPTPRPSPRTPTSDTF